MGTALSSVTFLGEMAKSRFKKKTEGIQPILERTTNKSREMMHTMRRVGGLLVAKGRKWPQKSAKSGQLDWWRTGNKVDIGVDTQIRMVVPLA